MPTLQYLPEWSVEYNYSLTNSILRDDNPGYVDQKRNSHRQEMIASAQRILYGAELPYFEYFIQEICREGSLSFTDYYADGSGVVQGNVRILNGSYSVSTNSRNHIVTCQLEILRTAAELSPELPDDILLLSGDVGGLLLSGDAQSTGNDYLNLS